MGKSNRMAALFSLVRYNLEAKHRSVRRIYVWLYYFKCGIGRVWIKHLPCNRICYKVCYLQSDYILFLRPGSKRSDALLQSFRFNPLCSCYAQAIVELCQSPILNFSSLFKYYFNNARFAVIINTKNTALQKIRSSSAIRSSLAMNSDAPLRLSSPASTRWPLMPSGSISTFSPTSRSLPPKRRASCPRRRSLTSSLPFTPA